MMKISFLLTLVVAVLACLLPGAPAQALAARTFVSAAGSDSNNCINVATPCRHMAAAYTATATDGEIYVLDPANYGSLTITHGVSIEGHGWASIAPTSGNPAITINALGATDKINIIGVVLDGTATANTTGIQFNSGGSLTVRDSVIRNFPASGISITPNAPINFLISNTIVSDNGTGIFFAYGGSSVSPSTTGVIDHVAATNNNNGITLNSNGVAETTFITISNTVSSNNGNDGLSVNVSVSSRFVVNIDSSYFNNNANDGIVEVGAGVNETVVLLGRSVISGNGTFGIGYSNGTFATYGDNRINWNNLNDLSNPLDATDDKLR
jgi:hypothetical protein